MLDTPIEFLKGVGPKRGELLKSELGIYTYEQLLYYFPFRYIDRSTFQKTNELNPDMSQAQIHGRLSGIKLVGPPRKQRLTAQLEDDYGTVDLVWFQGARFIKPTLTEGGSYIVFGKPTLYNHKYTITHPELSQPGEKDELGAAKLQPVYSSGEKLSGRGLNSKGIEKLIKTLLPQVLELIGETLSQEIIVKKNFISRRQAIRQIHFPTSSENLQAALFRLKFEEFFFLQLQLLRSQMNHKKVYGGFVFDKIGEHFNDFFSNHLPFELTNAQKRVVKEIRKDLGTGQHMNRLLQGDVGSGKTVVALLIMLIAKDNGFQATLMAPTEILAQQHFESLSTMLAHTDLKVALLTGSVKSAARKPIFEGILNGEIDFLVGTHALLEDKVKFKNLGISVIDEQHRFGVAQRARLWKKNIRPPHVLVMTATPIPRTLAMTFYGDLDVSVIDELPPGRKAIKTLHKKDSSRINVFAFMKSEIDKGRQIYVVYPLIKESETLDYKDLMDGYESIARSFPLPKYQIAIVHGKMKPADKDYEMNRFASGQANILVSTTVIEVGVNVPNASVMVIESAERFGLSQLHQLRGRVGRGADQSYCILMTGNKVSNEGKKRMEIMVRTTDGFEIAEEDLRLRGPGDIMGTQQSGLLDLNLADLAHDQQILVLARDTAKSVLENDPSLERPSNQRIFREFKIQSKRRPNWSRIS